MPTKSGGNLHFLVFLRNFIFFTPIRSNFLLSNHTMKYQSDIETLFPGRFWRLHITESVWDFMIWSKIFGENKKHVNISEWRPIENFWIIIHNEVWQNQTESVSQYLESKKLERVGVKNMKFLKKTKKCKLPPLLLLVYCLN